MNPNLRNFFMKKLTREMVVPTICAKASKLSFGITLFGVPFFPKLASRNILLDADVAGEQMRQKQLRKRPGLRLITYHARLIQPRDRRFNHGGGGCRMRPSPQASFAKKAACTQNANDRLFAKFGKRP